MSLSLGYECGRRIRRVRYILGVRDLRLGKASPGTCSCEPLIAWGQRIVPPTISPISTLMLLACSSSSFLYWQAAVYRNGRYKINILSSCAYSVLPDLTIIALRLTESCITLPWLILRRTWNRCSCGETSWQLYRTMLRQ